MVEYDPNFEEEQSELDLPDCGNPNCYDPIEIVGKYTVSMVLNDREQTTFTISVCGEGCQRDMLETFMEEHS